MANTSRPSVSVRVGPSSGFPTFSSVNKWNTAAFTDSFSDNSAAVGEKISSDAVINGVLSSLALVSSAAADWKDTPAAHIIKVDVPGPRRREGGCQGRRGYGGGPPPLGHQRPEAGGGDCGGRDMRRSGRFQRRFPRPDNAMVDEIMAALESGVLTVTVRKAEAKDDKKTKSIQILGCWPVGGQLRIPGICVLFAKLVKLVMVVTGQVVFGCRS
ncbi:hypothetical protein Cgig2_032684 [Carnegiea gigantea]|uniref:SHSP domain-containing protein n=1 Tax=Carnegiea gigantea TaxID=171969 RepID=A0A9Q1KJ25_9CARY|nr:hypothetical protein Cgig2_032684 [Carnegiea gigantea]